MIIKLQMCARNRSNEIAAQKIFTSKAKIQQKKKGEQKPTETSRIILNHCQLSRSHTDFVVCFVFRFIFGFISEHFALGVIDAIYPRDDHALISVSVC